MPLFMSIAHLLGTPEGLCAGLLRYVRETQDTLRTKSQPIDFIVSCTDLVRGSGSFIEISWIFRRGGRFSHFVEGNKARTGVADAAGTSDQTSACR
jgi:hypothetical protein